MCARLQELHARLEPLLIFTIDGASFIDADDPKWEVVAAVVQHNGRPYLVRSVLLSQPACRLQVCLCGCVCLWVYTSEAAALLTLLALLPACAGWVVRTVQLLCLAAQPPPKSRTGGWVGPHVFLPWQRQASVGWHVGLLQPWRSLSVVS